MRNTLADVLIGLFVLTGSCASSNDHAGLSLTSVSVWYEAPCYDYSNGGVPYPPTEVILPFWCPLDKWGWVVARGSMSRPSAVRIISHLGRDAFC